MPFQSCVVIITGTGPAGALSGYSATHIGYAGHFTVAAALCAAVISIVVMAQRRGLFLTLRFSH